MAAEAWRGVGVWSFCALAAAVAVSVAVPVIVIVIVAEVAAVVEVEGFARDAEAAWSVGPDGAETERAGDGWA